MALTCWCAPVRASNVDLSGVLVTTSGSTRASVRAVTFIFSSDFTGTISGIAFSGATDTSFTPPIQSGDSFVAISYVVTTGSIRIMYTK